MKRQNKDFRGIFVLNTYNSSPSPLGTEEPCRKSGEFEYIIHEKFWENIYQKKTEEGQMFPISKCVFVCVREGGTESGSKDLQISKPEINTWEDSRTDHGF